MALVFLPAMGDFISAQLLGGPDDIMIGNLIQEKFFAGQNWPLGAALTMALMVLLLLCMFAYLRQTARDAKEAADDHTTSQPDPRRPSIGTHVRPAGGRARA